MIEINTPLTLRTKTETNIGDKLSYETNMTYRVATQHSAVEIMKQLIKSIVTFNNSTLSRRHYLGLMVLNLVVCQCIVVSTKATLAPQSHMGAFTLLLVPYCLYMAASFAIVSARIKAAFRFDTPGSLLIQVIVLMGSAINEAFIFVSLLLGLALLFVPTRQPSHQTYLDQHDKPQQEVCS